MRWKPPWRRESKAKQNIPGDGFELVRPTPQANYSGAAAVDEMIPQAPWFWGSLNWYCVPGCCGLDAYEFSETAVRHALGQDVDVSDAILTSTWQVGNVDELIGQLTDAANQIGFLDAPFVTAELFNHFFTPAELADLLDDLAEKLQTARQGERVGAAKLPETVSTSENDRPEFYRDAARRYLNDRHAHWVAVYTGLANSGRQPDEYHYTDDAKNVFPRYNVLDAIAVEVDRLDPDALPTSEAILEWLEVAGSVAESQMTGRHEPGSIQEIAEADERREFLAFVSALRDGETIATGRLPYRRTLATEEAERWRSAIQQKWGLDGLDFWEPLRADVVRGRPVLALRENSFWAESEATGPASVAVRDALGALGVVRLIELREYGPEFERETETAELVYTGAEGLFFSEKLDWLIFASHEGVTTLGGSIVTQLRAGWPELEQFIWDELS